MATAMVMAAARKLGGFALRPPQATSAVEQSPLALLRPLYSLAKTQRAAARYLAETKQHMAEIKETKEWLFRVMSENRRVLGHQNCTLIKHLSFHVEPRPDDPVWRFYLGAKLMSYFWRFAAGPVSTGYVAMYHYLIITKSKEEVAAEALNKQEQEGRPLV